VERTIVAKKGDSLGSILRDIASTDREANSPTLGF